MTIILPLTVVALLGLQAQQQPPVPPVPMPQTQEAGAAVTLTGCVVSAEAEDTFKLVAAEPDPARPVGTSGTAPAWVVPGYLLQGGTISFAEHANKTVEVTGIVEPALPPVVPPVGDTTARTAPPESALSRLTVQAAKVVADTCTPRIAKK